VLVDVPSLSKPTGSTCAQNASVVPTGSRRGKIVELARNGRTPKELAEEFEPTQTTISGWPKQADRDEGARFDGPTIGERRNPLATKETTSAQTGTGHPGKSDGPVPRGRPATSRPNLPIHRSLSGRISNWRHAEAFWKCPGAAATGGGADLPPSGLDRTRC